MRKNTSLRVLLIITLIVLAAVMAFTVYAEEQAAGTNIQDGFVDADGVLYYYQDGKRVTGWFEVDGKQYYASRLTGIVENKDMAIGGKQYFWNETTGLTIADGFYVTDEGTICYDDGYRATGWRHTDGSGPSINADGFSEQYTSTPNNLYYFLPTTGYMVTDSTYTLGGYTREFNADHTVKPLNGFQTHEGNLYYYVDGVIQTG